MNKAESMTGFVLAVAAVVAVGCGGGVGDDKLMEEAKATARAGAQSVEQGTQALGEGLEQTAAAGATAVGAVSDAVKSASDSVATEASAPVARGASLVAEGAEAVREALDEARTAAAAGEATIYEVVAGDSLGSIASRHYGDASQYHRIAASNSGIQDPHLIYPGQVLRLPPNR